MARIVFATLGSDGDLLPCVRLGEALRSRGHDVVVATTELHRGTVTGAGIGFASVPPDLRPGNAELMAAVLDPVKGPERLYRGFVFPALDEACTRFETVAEGADLVVYGVLAHFARIVAEAKRVPHAALVLSPLTMFSACDPPILAAMPFVGRDLRFLGPGFHAFLIRQFERMSMSWCRPVFDIRKRYGLPTGGNVLFRGGLSPHLNLAMFPALFGPPQPDWPPSTVPCGFPLVDPPGLDADLQAFVADGPAPVVLALGSTSVFGGGMPYGAFVDAARWHGRRAVVLVGADFVDRWRRLAGPDIFVAGAAPYGALFAQAALTVHQGGVGTCAEALRAGRPMIVVPHANDQFDNADRARRLGIAEAIPLRRLTVRRLALAMGRMLADPDIARRAAEVGRTVQAQDGVGAAVAAIERAVAR
ncbi:MAG: glycosyltransferase family 1 protein [Rhodospirillaceae bacterium]|nr:glycosyltransferase family 1 protein [Rhodospirillaceae bacterium]